MTTRSFKLNEFVATSAHPSARLGRVICRGARTLTVQFPDGSKIQWYPSQIRQRIAA